MYLKYLNNFSSKESKDGHVFSFNLSPEIPFFKGHFPSQEILPAIVYLEISIFLLSTNNTKVENYSVKKSKFLAPLSSNDKIEVIYTTKDLLHMFEWYRAKQLVASLNITQTTK